MHNRHKVLIYKESDDLREVSAGIDEVEFKLSDEIDTHGMIDTFSKLMFAMGYQIQSINDAIVEKASEIEELEKNG